MRGRWARTYTVLMNIQKGNVVPSAKKGTDMTVVPIKAAFAISLNTCTYYSCSWSIKLNTGQYKVVPNRTISPFF